MDRETYQRAESFFPWNLQHTVHNSTLFPYWADKAVYYFHQTATTKTLVKIDLSSGSKEEKLNLQQLLNALSNELKQAIDATFLPLNAFSIDKNLPLLRFQYKNDDWCYHLEEHTLTKEIKKRANALSSPDEKWFLEKKEYNLLLINDNDQSIPLTIDGLRYFDYASSPETNTRAITEKINGRFSKPIALWAPNSRKIVTYKLDQRNVNTLFLLQHSPNDSKRPILHDYRMSFSGDDSLPQIELIIIDIFSRKTIPVKCEALLVPYLTPFEFKWVWWSQDSRMVYFLREGRASKELSLCAIDTNTGLTEIWLTEQSDTYIEPSQNFLWSSQVIVLEKTQEIVWLSERSGYFHLYLFDKGCSNPKAVITSGEWCVREVHFYDDKEDWIYFTACGYDKNIDPYLKQLFRCHLDGSKIECLTPEQAHHTVSFSLDNQYFLDTFSNIDTAPITILKTIDGKLISHVITADLHGLKKLNWQLPKRFFLKARDGASLVYGNLYFPSNFDSKQKYPIIDHIYPGPQVYRTCAHFNLYSALFRSVWTAQALAELGFIVIHVDGLGTPNRGKAFHHATYQNIGDCGIPDHVKVIKELADQYHFIDIERVGITGYSGGGYAAARAMLMYPDFYKVGVAAAGNHDLRCYPASYGEKYNSLDTSTYDSQSNAYCAEKLQGKLLLIHGEMDDNVHPCATLQLINALIKHNKDFDMLIMPNQNHKSTFDHPYYMRRHWDYFVKHLLGEIPPKDYRVGAIPENFPQFMDW